jgi:hypothetical protein
MKPLRWPYSQGWFSCSPCTLCRPSWTNTAVRRLINAFEHTHRDRNHSGYDRCVRQRALQIRDLQRGGGHLLACGGCSVGSSKVSASRTQQTAGKQNFPSEGKTIPNDDRNSSECGCAQNAADFRKRTPQFEEPKDARRCVGGRAATPPEHPANQSHERAPLSQGGAVEKIPPVILSIEVFKMSCASADTGRRKDGRGLNEPANTAGGRPPTPD